MEAKAPTVLHPNSITAIPDTIDNDEEISSPESNNIVENSDDILVLTKKNRIREMESEIEDKSAIINMLEDSVFVHDDVGVPRFNLDLSRMDVVKFSSELLQNLNLLLSYKRLGFYRKKLFDETLTYNKLFGDSFKELVLDKHGYLEEEENYFELSKEYVSKDTNTILLRNSRVILYWRSFELDQIMIKRILTLGLLFLIGSINKAELYFYIRRIIPDGTYEISIRNKENSFVLIGIEKPLFSY